VRLNSFKVASLITMVAVPVTCVRERPIVSPVRCRIVVDLFLVRLRNDILIKYAIIDDAINADF
jgi:hypothetical protein